MNKVSITKEELLFTYRKVKRELFYEKDYIKLDKILLFEENIESNINNLLSVLNGNKNETQRFFNNHENIGFSEFILKDIDFSKKASVDVKKSIKNLDRNLFEIKNIGFRFIGDLSIYFQIIGGLWLNRIGYKLDLDFPDNVYGCRLKKYDDSINIPYYKQNHTLYKPYFNDYKKWQNDLFNIIKEDKNVLVITSDLKKYYHSIEISELRFKVDKLIKKHSFNKTDLFINELLFQMIEHFNDLNNKNYQDFFDSNINNLDNKNFGLPLTLNASRVLANIYLLDFDQDIIDNLKPLYYGRYVDDLIIAVEYSGYTNDQLCLKDILKPLKSFVIYDNNSIFHEGFDTYLKFNPEKENIFVFNGIEDKIEVNQLKKAINKNSSEWKLLPDNSDYEEIENLDLFHDLNKSCEEVNGLRKSTGLILKRNKFIKEIVSFETFICSYNSQVWRKRLFNFLNIIESYIFDFKNFVDLNKYLPRLFGILIHSNNEDLIKKYFETLESVMGYIKVSKNINSTYFEKSKVFLYHKISENILTNSSLHKIQSNYAQNWVSKVLKGNSSKEDMLKNVIRLFNTDLHKIAYKDSFYKFPEFVKYLNNNINLSTVSDNLANTFFNKSIIEFIKINVKTNYQENSSGITDSTGFYFFTRRPSLLELTVTFKNKILDKDGFKDLAEKYYHKYSLSEEKEYDDVKNFSFVDFSDTKNKAKTRVCNTHFFTDDISFDAKVRILNDEPDVTRFDRLIKIVNDVIKESKSIDYLVFHELSLPRNMYVHIAKKLSFVGVNLIAGLEYKISGLTVDNQLVYILNSDDNRSGSIALYQSKLFGAIHESKEIYNKNGLSIVPKFEKKLVVKHNGFIFSGLICNDLLDINNRSVLRGNIDLLFVVAWNPDLETYQHLINSACLDLHCFVSICNNKQYGDTRIRAPYKDSWRRDLQKIHGGTLDSFIISEINFKELRDYQTNQISPDRPFKPFPTGFQVSNERKLK